ncbi:MAG: metal-dependent hydrolase, partial [Chitinophagaceae bacterium]
MDSLTHIALGSCIGELALGKKLGRKAMVWGLIAASLPDIDGVAGLFLSLPEELIAHRGITHSFIFAIVASALLAFVCRRLHQTRSVPFLHFYIFFLAQILLHDLLDTCNAYGTGLLEPFSSDRFSFNILYVADPLFSIWPLIAFIILLFYRRSRAVQTRLAAGSLLLSLVYIGVSINNKKVTNNYLVESFKQKGIQPTSYFSTPTPFNNMLWYTVADVDSGYYIGHLSVFDDRSTPIPFNFFKKRDYLLDSVTNKEEVQKLKIFADGYYTAERWNDTLVFNILRFGQMIGWQEPKAHFAFHYYLDSSYS